MAPEKLTQLEQTLEPQGLTVLMTRDYNAILLHLARLAQFERIMTQLAGADKSGRTADCLKLAVVMQEEPLCLADDQRPLQIIDIPEILGQVNRALYAKRGRETSISPLRLDAAVAAFVGILCAEPFGGA